MWTEREGSSRPLSALNMKRLGMATDTIVQATVLTKEEVEGL